MSTSRSGPRFASFLPNGSEDPLLLVGSGQTFGGFELIKPFQTDGETNYFQPELIQGESMTTVSFEEGELTIGTSYGRVLQYSLTNYEKTMLASKTTTSSLSVSARTFDGGISGRSTDERDTLDMPSFVPPPPKLSIDPSILIDNNKGWNVFDSYIMATDPIISEENVQVPSYFTTGAANITTLGPMATKALVAPAKRCLSQKIMGEVNPQTDKDLLETYEGDIKASEGKSNAKSNDGKTFPNPNKLLYSNLYPEFYDADVDPRKAIDSEVDPEDAREEDTINDEENGIPFRYKALVCPPFYKINSFNFRESNDTDLWVGWDYNPSWTNSWFNSVLTILYFIKEIRLNALQLQFHSHGVIPNQAGKPASLVSVISELGLLFNLIEQLPVNCLIHPDGTVKPFVASNFISSFTLLPEATNLALIDGVGESDISRKPEALYRFLVQYLDKELVQLGKRNVIDGLQGIDFISLIEYSSATQPKASATHSVTLDLSYDQKWNYTKLDSPIRFSDILRFSLCKATPLRAFNETTRAYETVTQRKIATSLPQLLALSCCCAGSSDSGLQFWQNENITNFLPEEIGKRHNPVQLINKLIISNLLFLPSLRNTNRGGQKCLCDGESI